MYEWHVDPHYSRYSEYPQRASGAIISSIFTLLCTHRWLIPSKYVLWVYFPWSCVGYHSMSPRPGSFIKCDAKVVCLRWLYHHMLPVLYTYQYIICIHIPRQLSFYSSLLCSLMTYANDLVHYVPMVEFVCIDITLPHHHTCANISDGIKLQKCLSAIFGRVCI